MDETTNSTNSPTFGSMKIFCIGFHKTGTTSLDQALKLLGYKVQGAKFNLVPDLKKRDYNRVHKIVNKFDAFQDNPWPIIYKELDEKYPGSKFILTFREDEKWLRSAVKHFGESNTEMREWIYAIGHPKGHENIYLERYQKHNAEVRNYFKDRPKDLLELSWERGDGWKELCEFLNKPIPEIDFPHANKATSKRKKNAVRKFLNKIKRRVLGH